MTIKDNITFEELDNCYTIFIELQSRNGGEVGGCLSSKRTMDRLYSISNKYNLSFRIFQICSDGESFMYNHHLTYEQYLSCLSYYESGESIEGEILFSGFYEAKTDYVIDTDKKVIGFNYALIHITGDNPYFYYKFENGLFRNVYTGEFTCNGNPYIGSSEVDIMVLPPKEYYILDSSKKKGIVNVATERQKERLGYCFDIERGRIPTYYEYDGHGVVGKLHGWNIQEFLIAKVFKSKFYLQQKEALNKNIEKLQQNQWYRYVTYNYNLDIIENSAKICSYKKDTIQDHRTNKEYSFAQIDERLLDLYEEYKFIYE